MAVQRIDTAEQFHTEYPRVREWLSKALKRQVSGGSEEDLLNGLVERKYLLWTSEHAVAVTQILNVDGADVCNLYLVGGKRANALDEILGDGMDEVEQWAKSKGCKGFYGIGRPGWENALAPHGFKVQSINLYREFE
ncbi:hypothetical protein [Agrobacterium rosae]|uniref:hypothetical protein n=1 Tax=Agrobacterium rosae TaxID=1972867 RepID=UPI000CD8D37E|nr:hypothetical protein [Agrobacterium rosae]POO56248.1 hypothetical protein CTT39_05805 [Agrobacterium rosae]